MAAFGFRPSRYTNGQPWNGATIRCSMLSTLGTAIFIGDSVILAGTSSTSAVDGAILNDVTHTSTTGKVYGIVTGVYPNSLVSPNLNIIYGPASVYREVMVCPIEPGLVFETTMDTAQEVTGASAVQGTMYDIATTAGSTTTGLSGYTVVTSGGSSTASAVWMIIGVRNDPANLATVGSVTASKAVIMSAATPTIIEVMCMEPQVLTTLVGAGV